MSLLSVLEQYFTVYHTTPFPADALRLSVDGQLLAIAGDLTPREKALLATLAPIPRSRNPWALFLTGAAPAPAKGTFRLLQLLTTSSPEQPQLWLTALNSLVSTQTTSFWLTPTQAVVVEPRSTTPLTAVALVSILNTLDNDFDTQTRGYCGQFWPASPQLPAIFQEEQQLACATDARCADLATVALSFYGATIFGVERHLASKLLFIYHFYV